MASRRLATVIDRNGVKGRLHQVALDSARKPIARVQLSDGSRIDVPFELLEHDDHGGYRLPATWRDFTIHDDSGMTIPVIEEKVRVDVQPGPEQRLKIRRRIVTRQEVVETPVRHERIEVESVPVDRLADEMPAPRQEGDVLVIPRVEEEIVVQRRFRVLEELRVRVVREERVHRETVELRRHELDIESSEQPSQPIPTNKRRGA